ncbi:MAG: DUF5658 family protein [Candidatus Bathyarchaeia archaeon]
MRKLYIYALILSLLVVIDTVLTLFAVLNLGMHELNPLMRLAIQLGVFAPVKLGSAFLPLAGVLFARKKLKNPKKTYLLVIEGLYVILVMLYCIVVVNNILQILLHYSVLW